MRKKKATLNILAAFLYEVIAIVSSFLLPRLILHNLGSDTNGITQSVSQFIGYVSLLSAGIGAVTSAALYKPLADKDIEKISSIVKATEQFMRKVSRIFLIALVILALIFPLFVIDEFDYFFTLTLVLILGIGSLSDYYFGLTYRMILKADQKQHITLTIKMIILIINTIASVILINAGASIHIIKIVSALIFMINPLFNYFYVRKKYKINKNALPDNTTISQRWDAFAHQLANFVNNNTDIAILVIVYDTKEVSVYTVYYLIFNGIRSVVSSTIIGTEAAFGNMIANGESKAVDKNLRIFEFLIHSFGIILYSSMALLITPFVDIYTKGIIDVNYHRPLFGYLISAIGFFITLKIPSQVIIRAAGHFKQTRNGSIMEVILNIVISLALVIPFGMVGLAIGTLTATIFRTIQYGIYSSRKIVNRSISVIVKRYAVTLLTVTIIVVLYLLLPIANPTTYFNWIVTGFIAVGICLFSTLVSSIVFYKNDFMKAVSLIKSMILKSPKK